MSKKYYFFKMIKILKLHHCAFRCKNSVETKKFYTEFLGLDLVKAFEIRTTKTKRKTKVLHTFYALKDSSCIAFFEDPSTPFTFKKQRDFDLHIALEVSKITLIKMFEKGKQNGIETRGIIDHGFISSAYFRDPNGYVIELSSPNKSYKNQSKKEALYVLSKWKS